MTQIIFPNFQWRPPSFSFHLLYLGAKSAFCLLAILSGLSSKSLAREMQPLSLQDAERYLILNNRQLKISQSEIRQQEWSCQAASARFLPKLGVSYELGDRYRGRTELKIEENLFSRELLKSLQLEKLDLDLLKIRYFKEANTLLYTLRQKYYEVVLAQQSLGAQKESVELCLEALQLEKNKLELGESTEFNVKQSKVALNTALSLYFNAQKQLKLAHNNLAELLNVDSETLAVSDKQIPIQSIPHLAVKIEQIENNASLIETEGVIPFSLETKMQLSLFTLAEVANWEKEALLNHPAIEEKERQIKRAEIVLKKVKGAQSPTVDLFAKWNVNHHRRRDSWEGGVAIKWPFSLQNPYQEKKARENILTETLQLEQKMAQIKMDVLNRLFEMEQALLSLLANRSRLQVAERALSLAKSRRDLGAITALEYRDTTLQLTHAKEALTRASYDLMQAYFGLRHDAALDLPAFYQEW